jgi:BioD-like phosphotransacetylase family protein
VANDQCLLVGSIEASSGKSTTILGIIHQLVQQGIKVTYGKPIGTSSDDSLVKMGQNNSFLADNLNLSSEQMRSPILSLDREVIRQRLTEKDDRDYTQALRDYVSENDNSFAVIEGPTNLWEGSLFDLSIAQMAEIIDTSVLLVARYSSWSSVANLLNAKQSLGDRLLGVVINDIPETELAPFTKYVKPYLEKRGIPVLGTIPQDRLLNSVSVRELSRRLDAKVLCRPDRLDLMVESLTIGAMNVNSALEYFRQRNNMVVVTGGDRTDLQMAALETATNCLILTGHTTPLPLILSRAEDLEIPILAVDSDTLTIVEIVDAAFGKVPISEPIKVKRVIELMAQNFDFERLSDLLGLEKRLVV